MVEGVTGFSIECIVFGGEASVSKELEGAEAARQPKLVGQWA